MAKRESAATATAVKGRMIPKPGLARRLFKCETGGNWSNSAVLADRGKWNHTHAHLAPRSYLRKLEKGLEEFAWRRLGGFLLASSPQAG